MAGDSSRCRIEAFAAKRPFFCELKGRSFPLTEKYIDGQNTIDLFIFLAII